MTQFKNNLLLIQKQMAENKIHILLIKSIDQYTRKQENDLFFATGFNGSNGYGLITKNKAFLFVDARYEIQSKKQVPHFKIKIASNNKNIEEEWIKKLAMLINKETFSFLINTRNISYLLYNKIKHLIFLKNLKIIQSSDSLIEKIRTNSILKIKEKYTISVIQLEFSGISVKNKLNYLSKYLNKNKFDAFLVTALDEIAWMTNLRSNQFLFKTTFNSIALVLHKKIIVCFNSACKLPQLPINIIPVKEKKFFKIIKKLVDSNKNIAIDIESISQYIYSKLEKIKAKILKIKSPILKKKSLKNKQELKHMQKSFLLADKVIFNIQKWAIDQFQINKKISEQMIYNFTIESFKKSGAIGLSFHPCCAAGINSAMIHYTSQSNKNIENGSLFLLDIGAYYKGGYATDLTRTFFLGHSKIKPTEKQKKLYTLVLKGTIAGLTAKIPKGLTGAELDNIVRKPIKNEGFNYSHGTGHGIGINVHEKLPIISSQGQEPLQKKQIFSIEPGIYLQNWGGIRLENIATLVDDQINNDYLRVLPLTFAPFDANLINNKLLTNKEKIFLKYFTKRFLEPYSELQYLPPI